MSFSALGKEAASFGFKDRAKGKRNRYSFARKFFGISKSAFTSQKTRKEAAENSELQETCWYKPLQFFPQTFTLHLAQFNLFLSVLPD